jgi:hypothetical protein
MAAYRQVISGSMCSAPPPIGENAMHRTHLAGAIWDSPFVAPVRLHSAAKEPTTTESAVPLRRGTKF